MSWLALANIKKEAWAGLDSYGQHQAIWKMFPGRDGKARNFLFRVDDMGAIFRVFVLANEKPVFDGRIGWRVKEVPPTYFDHKVYRFQLKANPTMRRKEDGRRLGLFKEDLLFKWMLRKASLNGFEVNEKSLVVGAPVEERFRRGATLGKHLGVDFTGVLRVVDKQKFKKAFEEGIGSAKGFGFGLLMLQPL